MTWQEIAEFNFQSPSHADTSAALVAKQFSQQKLYIMQMHLPVLVFDHTLNTYICREKGLRKKEMLAGGWGGGGVGRREYSDSR